MKTLRPKLIAITGGSGSGKTWLAEHLQEMFPAESVLVSQDNFYRDRSRVPVSRRAVINFDHPRALDWPLLESFLRACWADESFPVPVYDFATHIRLPACETFAPKSLVLVEGLWLLRRPSMRKLFDFSIYLDCPEAVRLERRLQRDTLERQRSPSSIKKQFRDTVAPMHLRFVASQMRHADLVLAHPFGEHQIKQVANRISAMLTEAEASQRPTAGRFARVPNQTIQP